MTATASLRSFEPPPFATTADKDAWIAEREAELSALLAVKAAEITRTHLTAYADSLTASGDAAAFDGMNAEWTKFLNTEFAEFAEGMHLAGSYASFGQAPGSVTTATADAWVSVVNDEAVAYAAAATNRVVGMGPAMWSDVRERAVLAIRTGIPNEQLKDEIEAITGYSEFRADTIARTETVGAFNGGEMDGARALGDYAPVAKVWNASRDQRTRRTHRDADGQIRLLDDKFEVGSTAMDRPHDRTAPPSEVVNCRCIVDFLYPGDPELDEFLTELGVDLPPDVDAGPPDWVPPDLEGVDGKLTRDTDGSHLGGVHPKDIYTDESGAKYLFKPMDEHLAHAEALASELGERAGLNVARVTVKELDGRVGSLQRLLPDARPGFKGTPASFDPTFLTAGDLAELQKQRVLDWMVSNHDGHSNQWVRNGYANQGVNVTGIDKGQAFKYFGDDSIEFKWKPKDRLHDPPSVYSAVEKAYSEGRITTKQFMRADGKNAVNQTVKTLEAIPDAEYAAMLRPYAAGRWTDPADIERFISAAVDRKNTMGKELANYHLRLYKLNLKARKASAPPKPPVGNVKGGPKGMVGRDSVDNHVFGNEVDHPVDRAKRHEVQELIDYTGSEYQTINTAAREGRVTAKMRAIDKHMLPVKDDVIVYRGTHIQSVLPPGGHQALPGTVFQDRAYLSTFVDNSKNAPGIASGDTGFRVMVPQGTKGRWVTGASNHASEREFVLSRNAPLYVHKVRKSSGAGWEARFEWIVDVEVVDEEWAREQGVKIWDSNAKTYR